MVPRSTAIGMGAAAHYRVVALDVVKGAVNEIRRLIYTQFTLGQPNASGQDPPAHGGLPSKKIDRQLDELIYGDLVARVPNVNYWSEEMGTSYFLEDEKIYAWCDPVDGTSNLLTFGMGGSCVLFLIHTVETSASAIWVGPLQHSQARSSPGSIGMVPERYGWIGHTRSTGRG